MGRRRQGVLSKMRYYLRMQQVTQPEYDYVRGLLLDPCAYCGQLGPDSFDHIWPRSHTEPPSTGFGRDHWTNLTPCHLSCNIKKGTASILGWLVSQKGSPTL